MTVLRALFVVAALTSWSSRARAYGEHVGVLLEPTYMLPVPLFLRGGEAPDDGRPTRTPATFEASIALHVPLTSSLDELETRDGFAHAFTFIPRVDLRHGLGDSFPVRTPSFYPTVRFQGFFQDHPRPGLRRRFLAELVFAHLSNGQDGCFYRDQRKQGGRCRFEDERSHLGAPLNHVDGSFAMNEVGLRAGLDLRWGDGPTARELTALLGWVAFRPRAGGLDPEIQALYGWGRVEAQLRVARAMLGERPGRFSLGARARGELRHGGDHVQNALGLLVDGFMRFPVLRDWGPFVRAYYGGDYYNVRFDARALVLGLGMMWEP